MEDGIGILNEHGADPRVFTLVQTLKKIHMNQQTWLITGATGLIGTALCAELVARGYEVRAMGRGTSHPEGTTAYA